MSPNSPSRRRPRRARRAGRPPRVPGAISAWVPALLGVAAVAAAVLAVSSLFGARRDLIAARSALESARSALSAHDVAGGRDAMARADALLDAATAQGRRLPLSLLRPVPLIGSPVKALAAGVRAGREVAAAGRVLHEAASSFPTSGTAGLDGHDLTGFHAAAQRSAAALVAADGHLAAARRALRATAGATLPQVSGPARSLLATIDDARGELASAGRGVRLLSRLTASETDVRLLFLSQDSMELRATGGFIGSFGVLRFAHGSARLERYDDTFEGLPPPRPPMDPPGELARVKIAYWELSNSNWWPDFPTSARTAAEMFRRQGGGEVAGVVAVTEHVMARLVGAVGPITLPGSGEPVTEEGFAERVLYEVEEKKRPQDVPRKQFLVDLAHEMFRRLFSLPADRLPALVDAVAGAAGSGDLQVWFADPAWQAEIAGTALEGALPRAGGDVLLLAGSNMTGSKANADLVRRADYQVRREPGGGLLATLEIDYHNQGAKSRTNPYYNEFLRVYVPKGAELVGGGDEDTFTEDAPDGPYTVISHRLLLHPGEHEVVTFRYRLPEGLAAGGRYRLTWLRQPGTPADTLTATVGNRTYDADPAQRRLEVTADLGR